MITMGSQFDEMVANARRPLYVADAWDKACSAYIGPAIVKHTTADFYDLIKGALVGLLAAVLVLITTTLVGAGVGAIIGEGVGAIPGAAVGFRVGVFILNWLGIGFLIVYVASHLDQVGNRIGNGIGMAWNSRGSSERIDLAAREIAEGIG